MRENKSIVIAFLLTLMPGVNAWCDYDSIDGCSVQEEAPATALPFFVYPNELKAHYLHSALQGKTGVLISVGTFRTLFDVSMGEFSRVVMLDNDETITRFNRAHIALLEALNKTSWDRTKQRLVYVALLTLKTFALKDVDHLVPAANENMRLALKTLLRKLRTRPIVDAINPSVEFGDEAFNHAAENFYMRAGAEDADKRFYEVNDMNGTNIGMTHWRSNEAFEKVMKLIAAHRITVLSGDITGTTTLANIAACLEKANEPISVLDISNALDSIHTNVDKIHGFIGNFAKLPLAEGMTIITTIRSAQLMNEWLYMLIDPDLVEDLQYIFDKIKSEGSLSSRDLPVNIQKINKYVYKIISKKKGLTQADIENAIEPAN